MPSNTPLQEPLLAGSSDSEDLEAQVAKPAPQIIYYREQEEDEARRNAGLLSVRRMPPYRTKK